MTTHYKNLSMLLYENLSSAEQKAVNDCIAEEKEHYVCNVCFTSYKRQGNCRRHVYAEHFSTVQERAAKINESWEKKEEKMLQDYAVKAGREYFELLESRVLDLLKEVQRYHRYFEDDLEEKPYAVTKDKRKKSQMVNEIGSCIHHVTTNFNSCSHQGVIAIKYLMSAFKFDA